MLTHQQQSSFTDEAVLGNPASTAKTVPPYVRCQPTAFTVAMSEAPRGKQATIRDIRAHGVLGRRLRDMGLLPGVAVTLVSRAPLGDPLVVELDGYALSVRCAEAACVIVEIDQ